MTKLVNNMENIERNEFNLDNLIHIGEVKVNWIYEAFENDTIRTALYDFYVPKVLEDKYGKCYANRFTILDEGRPLFSECIESYNFKFELLEVENDVYKVNILDDIVYLNKEQYEKMLNIYNSEKNKY